MTKFDWEAFAKKVKAQKQLEAYFLEGPSSISGVSEWEKRMKGRCPLCSKKVKDEERLSAHIYYTHSKEYQEQRKRIKAELQKQPRWEALDGNSPNAMQEALIEAARRSRQKVNE